MLQVEAKFGTDLQLIKYIDIRGISESFKETQTEIHGKYCGYVKHRAESV